jgi:hypothetical protein
MRERILYYIGNRKRKTDVAVFIILYLPTLRFIVHDKNIMSFEKTTPPLPSRLSSSPSVNNHYFIGRKNKQERKK